MIRRPPRSTLFPTRRPSDLEAHRIMGSLSMYLQQWDKARFHFERALEMNPNNAYVVDGLVSFIILSASRTRRLTWWPARCGSIPSCPITVANWKL